MGVLSEADSQILANKPNWSFEAARDFITTNFEKDYDFIDVAMILVPFILSDLDKLLYEDGWWLASTLYDITMMVEGEGQSIKLLNKLAQFNSSPSIQSFSYQTLSALSLGSDDVEKAQQYFDKAMEKDASHPWIGETRQRLLNNKSRLGIATVKKVLQLGVGVAILVFVLYQLSVG